MPKEAKALLAQALRVSSACVSGPHNPTCKVVHSIAVQLVADQELHMALAIHYEELDRATSILGRNSNPELDFDPISGFYSNPELDF